LGRWQSDVLEVEYGSLFSRGGFCMMLSMLGAEKSKEE
jgi:hypothetical protein